LTDYDNKDIGNDDNDDDKGNNNNDGNYGDDISDFWNILLPFFYRHCSH